MFRLSSWGFRYLIFTLFLSFCRAQARPPGFAFADSKSMCTQLLHLLQLKMSVISTRLVRLRNFGPCCLVYLSKRDILFQNLHLLLALFWPKLFHRVWKLLKSLSTTSEASRVNFCKISGHFAKYQSGSTFWPQKILHNPRVFPNAFQGVGEKWHSRSFYKVFSVIDFCSQLCPDVQQVLHISSKGSKKTKTICSQRCLPWVENNSNVSSAFPKKGVTHVTLIEIFFKTALLDLRSDLYDMTSPIVIFRIFICFKFLGRKRNRLAYRKVRQATKKP